MVEIEELTPFRFYKLKPFYKQRCTTEFVTGRKCNGLLRLFRNKGMINLKCMHVDCLKEYDIYRDCSICNERYFFDKLTCDKCEPLVVNIAHYYITIEDADKSIKKINKHYKSGDMLQSDWEAAISLNKQEKISCENKLKELKERNPVIEQFLANLIIQP